MQFRHPGVKVDSKAYVYRTHCRPDHRARRRRRCRISCERIRQQASRPRRSHNCRPSTFWSPSPTSASASRSSRTICSGRPGRPRPPATVSSAAANARMPPTQIAGSIARAPFIAGEPIREQKLVKANGSGFMAAILPTGMRAISTEISPETGAGGFILPNDRVDVILSKREKNADRAGCSRHRQLGNHPDQCPRARDRSGARRKKTARTPWSARP